MFKQGKRPSFTVPFARQEGLIYALHDAGYFLDRLKFSRRNEVGTFRYCYMSKGEKRQVHVQLVARISSEGKRLIDVYAHTEPADSSIFKHTLSAFIDGACYQAGSRMLKAHLKEVGFKV
jgi:hypothetical protein